MGCYRPTITEYRLPDRWTGPDGQPCDKNAPGATRIKGKRVKKGEPGARKVTRKSKTYVVTYRDADGIERRVRAYEDKAPSKQLEARLTKRAALLKEGMIDPFEDHARRPLTEHLADFIKNLAAKDNTVEHVELTDSRVKAILDACRFAHIRDLKPGRVMEYLAERRKLARAAGGISTATSNHYLRAIKGFSAWLVRDRRTATDDLKHLAMLNAETDRRHQRRSVPREEFAWLLLETQASPRSFRGLDGPARFLLYSVAGYTGLRASELASLTPASFNLAGDPPTVTVQAGYSKRRQKDNLPLNGELARMVGDFIREQERPADAPVWAGWPRKTAAKMLRKDLADARAAWIEAAGQDAQERQQREESSFLLYQDHAGLFFDFHACRGQFITELSRSGVHPKTAQMLARHSSINLTMNTYTHLGMVDMAGAVESLPAPPTGSKPEAAQATGTDGRLCTRLRTLPASHSRPLSATGCHESGEDADDESDREPREMQAPGHFRPFPATAGHEAGAAVAEASQQIANPSSPVQSREGPLQ